MRLNLNLKSYATEDRYTSPRIISSPDFFLLLANAVGIFGVYLILDAAATALSNASKREHKGNYRANTHSLTPTRIHIYLSGSNWSDDENGQTSDYSLVISGAAAIAELKKLKGEGH